MSTPLLPCLFSSFQGLLFNGFFRSPSGEPATNSLRRSRRDLFDIDQGKEEEGAGSQGLLFRRRGRSRIRATRNTVGTPPFFPFAVRQAGDRCRARQTPCCGFALGLRARRGRALGRIDASSPHRQAARVAGGRLRTDGAAGVWY